jgi:hypothetical protein
MDINSVAKIASPDSPGAKFNYKSIGGNGMFDASTTEMQSEMFRDCLVFEGLNRPKT